MRSVFQKRFAQFGVFLEAFDANGDVIGGLFAGRGWIWHKDYTLSSVYKHLKFRYDERYPRYERVKFYEIRTSAHTRARVIERFDNRYYRDK
jgi:hypothetical protein